MTILERVGFASRRAGVVLFALSLSAWSALYAQTGPVTVIDVSATGCDTTQPGVERTNLVNALTAAGNTVTAITTGVVPADLTGQRQVWDIRCQTALTAGEITTYTNYLAGGGSLFLMGENAGFGASRNPSLVSFIATMGGGTVALTASNTGNTQTVRPPFTGPNTLTTMTYRAVGGTTTSGTGSFVTVDSNGYGGAIVFSPDTMSAATAGTLIIVWDVNFLDSAAGHTAAETALMNNLIAYLAAPTPIAPPSSVPVLSPASMAALGLLLCGIATLVLRRKFA